MIWGPLIIIGLNLENINGLFGGPLKSAVKNSTHLNLGSYIRNCQIGIPKKIFASQIYSKPIKNFQLYQTLM